MTGHVFFPSVGAVLTPQRRICSPFPPTSPTSKVDTLGKCSVCAELEYVNCGLSFSIKVIMNNSTFPLLTSS